MDRWVILRNLKNAGISIVLKLIFCLVKGLYRQSFQFLEKKEHKKAFYSFKNLQIVKFNRIWQSEFKLCVFFLWILFFNFLPQSNNQCKVRTQNLPQINHQFPSIHHASLETEHLICLNFKKRQSEKPPFSILPKESSKKERIKHKLFPLKTHHYSIKLLQIKNP